MIPAIILIQLAVPSLILLYTLDEARRRGVLFKIMGHQWYWTYEFRDWGSTSEDREAYILGEERERRLLGVDRRVSLPYQVRIRGIVRSGDVLHA